MHRRSLVRALVALLVLLGAVQGAAAATMPFFCCSGIPPDDMATMQAGDDCGVTCSACAVCHSTALIPPASAQPLNGASPRLVGSAVDLLPFTPEPFHRPPRA